MHGRLAALRRDGIVLHWTPEGDEPEPQCGDGIEVRFAFDDEPLAFFAEVSAANPAAGAGLRVLMLRPPLRIDRVERRRWPRRTFALRAAAEARLTCMLDERRTLVGRLVDVSASGLAVVAAIQDLRIVQPGELFWAEFTLPDSHPGFEFVVRPAQWRTLPPRHARIGWSFYPEDNGGDFQRQLARLDESLLRLGSAACDEAPRRR